VSLGSRSSHGVTGAEVGAQLGSAGPELRAGATLGGMGVHLRGELTVRANYLTAAQAGWAELLLGVRYYLRPLELFLLAGPNFGMSRDALGVRALAGLAFSNRAENVPEAARREAPPECVEELPYQLADCPNLDRDGDLVLNGRDRCPEEPGQRDNAGCPYPDTDGDTLIDPIDNCPKVRGPVENQGCPVEEKQLVIIRPQKLEILDKVYFEFDKATLLEQSFPLLNQVAAVVKEHPEIKRVRIEGHTDNVGTAEYNLTLSLQRAESVRAYLIERGVDPERLDARGYGRARPITTNETEEGRAENRRVEFVIVER
jgi:OmpA-OmpF porin, OOP family